MVVIVFRHKDGMRQNATKDSIVFAHNCFTGYEIGKTILNGFKNNFENPMSLG